MGTNHEIIFRGKRIDNGQWVEGDLIECHKSFIRQKGDDVKESDIIGQDGVMTLFAFEVIPETVSQFTGLKDKNGTKIFEGDILNAQTDCAITGGSDYFVKCKVVFSHKGYGAEIGFTGQYLNSGMLFNLPCEGSLEIMGNVHNPERLT